MTYAIYKGIFEEVEKKLNRVIKKCQKHGNAFTYEIKGEETRKLTHTDEETGESFEGLFKFVMVEVEGTAKVDNFEAVAVLEIHKDGNVIRRINNDIEIPERFKTSANICEHCNSKRHRKNLYIIHNTETGEFKQVGGDCLLTYTRGLSLEYIAAYVDGLAFFEEYNGMLPSHAKPAYEVKTVLGLATELIEKVGYISASSRGVNTKSMLRTMFIYGNLKKAVEELNKDLTRNNIDVCFTVGDFEKEDTEKRVDDIIAYYNSLTDNSEFTHNIKVLLSEETVTAKNFGFLAYLPEGYKKHLEEERVKVERMKTKSLHFGEVGKRYKGVELFAVEHLASWLNDYGVVNLYKITVKINGELIALNWRSSCNISDEAIEKASKIDFTVKSHGEYKGNPQTELTRCKLVA